MCPIRKLLPLSLMVAWLILAVLLLSSNTAGGQEAQALSLVSHIPYPMSKVGSII
jgi:hypothetical protein